MIPDPPTIEQRPKTGRWRERLGPLLSILLHLAIGALFLNYFGHTTRHLDQEQVMSVELSLQPKPAPEPPPPEPPKPEPPKPEPPAPEPEPPKPEPPKPEPPKPEPPKPEPPKPEPPKPPEPRPEPPKAEKPPAAPLPLPPPPQLERGKVAEKSSPPQGRAKSEPSPAPKAPASADGLAPAGEAATARSEAWVKGMLEKSPPVTQSEHDFILAQILKMWRVDPNSYVPPDLVIFVDALVLANGELGSPLNKADPWNPGKLMPNYTQQPPYLKKAIDSFILAIRLAQPLELPQQPPGYWPRRMKFAFRFSDVRPTQ